jgi:hypothetical protein
MKPTNPPNAEAENYAKSSPPRPPVKWSACSCCWTKPGLRPSPAVSEITPGSRSMARGELRPSVSPSGHILHRPLPPTYSWTAIVAVKCPCPSRRRGGAHAATRPSRGSSRSAGTALWRMIPIHVRTPRRAAIADISCGDCRTVGVRNVARRSDPGVHGDTRRPPAFCVQYGSNAGMIAASGRAMSAPRAPRERFCVRPGDTT